MPARWWSARSILRRSAAISRRAATIKYIAKLRDMEIWLAPIAGTRVLVPFQAQGPTPIGEAVMRGDPVRDGRHPDPRLRRWQ